MAENNTNILLVDDDTFLLDMYALKFKGAGFVVDTAKSGREALEKLKNGATPQIILLDIIMPTMDGLEFLEQMRSEKIAPTARVIMLTNQADDQDKAEALGIDGFIVKALNIPSDVVKKVLEIYNKDKKKN